MHISDMQVLALTRICGREEHIHILKSSDWTTCWMTVITCRFTAIGFVFLLSRDDAAELQTTARCTVLFLPEGEASRRIWSEPTEPAKPRLRVSNAAELSIMLKNIVNLFRWSYTIYICDFSFFFNPWKSSGFILIHEYLYQMSIQ